MLIAGLKMGVAGAAIATDISQLVSCVLSLRFLMKVDADYKVELSAIRPDQRMTSRIIRIGLPTGIQNMVISSRTCWCSPASTATVPPPWQACGLYEDRRLQHPARHQFQHGGDDLVGQNYGAGNLNA